MISLEKYRDKLKAAFLSRCAGCTLGAPVEGWTSAQMKEYASSIGMAFPPRDYWTMHPSPFMPRFNEQFRNYTKPCLDHVPSDDDIGYTFLSLLNVEAHGKDFTVADVAETWLKYMTISFTAEEVAMNNLKNGVPPEKAGETENPYSDWIGADIRCDGYAYICPCDPEKAAKMAETDALISHRGEGVYGSRFFAAAISAAFGLDDAVSAITEGLRYIPRDSELYAGVSFALDKAPQTKDYAEVMSLVDARYPGMNNVHTLNNACLTVFALARHKRVGDIISECVAMGHDCDCTAATAGSLAGAAYGMSALDSFWYSPFGDKVSSYFNDSGSYSISDLLRRYERLAFNL